MTEVWKEVKGYEGLYQVSNLGSVKSLDRMIENRQGVFRFYAGKMLSPTLDTCGYPMVRIRSKRATVHRLVAEAFIPNIENKETVNHLNGIKHDNRVENLCWATRSENMVHAFETGLNKSIAGWESIPENKEALRRRTERAMETRRRNKLQTA